MSEVRVNNIVDYGGKGAPTFDNGAVISGVSSLGSQAKIGSNVTITSGGINVSGVTTAATLSGNLTGDVNSGFVTATSAVIGSGVTINAGGLNITGVMTATTFEGSGASMTGVAMTITPLAYNPDVNDSIVEFASGIGITFDHRILAGSGNVTLSIATNAGAAGTTVENFGVGSSVTIAGRRAVIDPTSNMTAGDTYHISYPSGCFTNTSGDVSYVGTAYTFGLADETSELYAWGENEEGLGINVGGPSGYRSSPTQVPGNTWSGVTGQNKSVYAVRTDGTLWAWGANEYGALGLNDVVHYSSPVQIPGTTWKQVTGFSGWGGGGAAVKTDGTLWTWGGNNQGMLGINSSGIEGGIEGNRSSPVQVPGTNWDVVVGSQGLATVFALRTDGTLWAWGQSDGGARGDNSPATRSSPTQVGSDTTWTRNIVGQGYGGGGIKTDGTLWVWGQNQFGQLAQNNTTNAPGYSSPIQVPGTNWSVLSGCSNPSAMSGGGYKWYHAIKTDGTLWAWGANTNGALGINSTVANYSSPVQVPGTTWATVSSGNGHTLATKTDGTLWAWGGNGNGQLGNGDASGTSYSSPIQISGTDWDKVNAQYNYTFGTKLVPLV